MSPRKFGRSIVSADMLCLGEVSKENSMFSILPTLISHQCQQSSSNKSHASFSSVINKSHANVKPLVLSNTHLFIQAPRIHKSFYSTQNSESSQSRYFDKRGKKEVQSGKQRVFPDDYKGNLKKRPEKNNLRYSDHPKVDNVRDGKGVGIWDRSLGSAEMKQESSLLSPEEIQSQREEMKARMKKEESIQVAFIKLKKAMLRQGKVSFKALRDEAHIKKRDEQKKMKAGGVVEEERTNALYEALLMREKDQDASEEHKEEDNEELAPSKVFKLSPTYLIGLKQRLQEAQRQFYLAGKKTNSQEFQSELELNEVMETSRLALVRETTDLIHVNALAKRPNEALAAFSQLLDLQVRPTVAILNVLLQAQYDAGLYEGVVALFQKMHSEYKVIPNVNSYRFLIKAFSKRGDYVAMNLALANMRTNKIAFTNDIYYALIEGAVEAKKLWRAWQVFDQLRCEIVQPSVEIYALMIKACALRGDAEKALDLFQDMADKGVSPSQATFVHLIEAMASRNDYASSGFELAEQMHNENFAISAQVYEALLECCVVQGDIERARLIWNEMILKSKLDLSFEPSMKAMQTMLKVFSMAITRLKRGFKLKTKESSVQAIEKLIEISVDSAGDIPVVSSAESDFSSAESDSSSAAYSGEESSSEKSTNESFKEDNTTDSSSKDSSVTKSKKTLASTPPEIRFLLEQATAIWDGLQEQAMLSNTPVTSEVIDDWLCVLASSALHNQFPRTWTAFSTLYDEHGVHKTGRSYHLMLRMVCKAGGQTSRKHLKEIWESYLDWDEQMENAMVAKQRIHDDVGLKDEHEQAISIYSENSESSENCEGDMDESDKIRYDGLLEEMMMEGKETLSAEENSFVREDNLGRDDTLSKEDSLIEKEDSSIEKEDNFPKEDIHIEKDSLTEKVRSQLHQELVFKFHPKLSMMEKEEIRYKEGRSIEDTHKMFALAIRGFTKMNEIQTALDLISEAKKFREEDYLPRFYFRDMTNLVEKCMNLAYEGQHGPIRQLLSLLPEPKWTPLDEVKKMLRTKHLDRRWWGWEALGIGKHKRQALMAMQDEEFQMWQRKHERKESKKQLR